MKLMIASDIHGSAHYCQLMLQAYQREGASRLVLLGDILYHGPRNDLPEGYAPKQVIALLNPLKEQLLCVRGNCDAYVDQMVLDFPILSDSMLLFLDGRMVYATHGHLQGKDQLPPLGQGDILLQGHTHLMALEACDGYYYFNPGSVALPKGEDCHSYMTYENGCYTLKRLQDGAVLKTLHMQPKV